MDLFSCLSFTGSYEQSPRFRSFEDMDDFHLEPRDSQLREDLADAMRDCSTGGGAGMGNAHNSGKNSLWELHEREINNWGRERRGGKEFIKCI